LLAGPDHPAYEEALGVFRRVAGGELVLLVTPVIVAELVYVVRRVLGWTRDATAESLSALLQADGLVLSEARTLRRSLEIYGTHSHLDFADAYLAAAALEIGPAVVVSFDRDLDSIEGVRRLAS
jgi:predicted nucleic acid-binding protein